MTPSPSIRISAAMSKGDSHLPVDNKIPNEKNVERLHREASSHSDAPYSVYSRCKKGIIVALVAFAALFSTFTINIYFPAILDIASSMKVPISLMNLSITIYMIFQGLTPGLFAAVSDSVGRRPTYIICFIVYVASNIGLALTDTFWLLMLLRAIQATGNSATVALGAGVIADIALPHERGGYLGVFGLGPLTGPSLGPIVGGALAQSLGWRSIFWFLAIFGGVFMAFLLMFLPETLRSIVGNGSIRATNIFHIRFLELFSRRRKDDDDFEDGDAFAQRSTLAERKKTNILESFKIILEKDVSLILFIPSIHYAVFVMITTSIPPLFIEHYHLNVLHIGLSYLAIGIGTLVGSVGWGKLLDRDWRIVEQRYIDAGHQKPKGPSDLVNFPLEHARTRSCWYPLVCFWAACAAYGWAVQYNVNLAIPLIFQAVVGITFVAVMSSFQALMIDLHPGRSASATASLNLVRCLLGAGGSAITQPMLTRLNPGWTHTLLAILCLMCSVPLILAERRWGMKWRREREERIRAKTQLRQGSQQNDR